MKRTPVPGLLLPKDHCWWHVLREDIKARHRKAAEREIAKFERMTRRPPPQEHPA